jgi:hypothetical protein
MMILDETPREESALLAEDFGFLLLNRYLGLEGLLYIVFDKDFSEVSL